jgi:endonuclease YncB( thermonuclease family)
MHALIACVILLTMSTLANAATTTPDANTLIVDGVTYRLEGVDAPQTDQVCADVSGAKWWCGVDARDKLKERVDNRPVRCDDKGRDRAFKERRVGICWIGDEKTSVNQWLVREGWALNAGPRGGFNTEQEQARQDRKGLWKGCFVSPDALRRLSISTTPMLGTACPRPNNWKVREMMFPEYPDMPPGCPIKGRAAMRAQVAGYLGIYHTEDCASYRRTRQPHRWFCSEEEAKASGYRRSYTCGSGR